MPNRHKIVAPWRSNSPRATKKLFPLRNLPRLIFWRKNGKWNRLKIGWDLGRSRLTQFSRHRWFQSWNNSSLLYYWGFSYFSPYIPKQCSYFCTATDGAASIFSATDWFKPTSEELHQTGTFWRTLYRLNLNFRSFTHILTFLIQILQSILFQELFMPC